MEESEIRNRADPGHTMPGGDKRDSMTQTESRIGLQGEPTGERNSSCYGLNIYRLWVSVRS